MPDFAPFSLPVVEAADQLKRLTDFRNHMATRRTIRDFSPRPFPVEWIEQAIATAATAPSGANQQPWRFVIVSDPELKRQIRIAAEAEERENYENRFPQEWLDALTPFGTDWQKPFLEICPYILVVFRIDYGLEGDRKIKHYYVQESVGIATGFLLAALHLAGLATLTHTPSPMGFLGQILDRPTNERPFLLIPIGYPAPDAQVPVLTKKTLDEVRVLR